MERKLVVVLDDFQYMLLMGVLNKAISDFKETSEEYEVNQLLAMRDGLKLRWSKGKEV